MVDQSTKEHVMNIDSKPPSHLSAESKKLFEQVQDSHHLEPHHVKILVLACETWDEVAEARKAIKKHGSVFMDRYNQPKERPEAGTARAGRALFSRLVRELGLDIETTAESRPPRIGGGT